MKRYFTGVFLLVLLISITFHASALRADIITKNLPDVQAGSYVIYDADTNEVLFGNNYIIKETKRWEFCYAYRETGRIDCADNSKK